MNWCQSQRACSISYFKMTAALFLTSVSKSCSPFHRLILFRGCGQCNRLSSLTETRIGLAWIASSTNHGPVNDAILIDSDSLFSLPSIVFTVPFHSSLCWMIAFYILLFFLLPFMTPTWSMVFKQMHIQSSKTINSCNFSVQKHFNIVLVII